MHSDGFMKVEGMFSQAEVNSLRASVFEMLHRTGEDRKYREGGRMQWRNGYPALMFWPRLINWAFDNTTTDHRLAEFVKSELGDDVRQLNNQVYFRLPGDGDAFDWHQDMAFRQNVQPGIETAYLQTMICIDPMTVDNGCLWFLPGAEEDVARSKPPRTEPKSFPWEVALTADPGDLLAWTATAVHGSRKNTSQQSRMTYMNGFAKAEFCEAWPWYLKGGLLQDCDKALIPYD